MNLVFRFSFLASRFSLFIFLLAASASADKIIMKDGKIYEGHIMGEGAKSVLIRINQQAKPQFIALRDVQTIIRESHPADPIPDEAGRFATVEVMLLGTAFGHDTFHIKAAPGINVAGGFRIHPALELGGGINVWPALSGEVTLTDGTTVRGYEKFNAWSGGFHAKVFPFYRRREARAEPYVMSGYHWCQLTPAGSGDYFTGRAWFTGVGVSWRWFNPVFVEGRFLYQKTSFDSVKFQSGQGSVSGVGQEAYQMGLGLSYRFL